MQICSNVVYYLLYCIFLISVYDINAMILMSSLVFIDLEECVERLEKLTYTEKVPPPEKPKKKNPYYEPKVLYGEYLQKMHVPVYSTHSAPKKKQIKSKPIGYKFKLRSDDLEKRLERNKKAKQAERVCTYKFWEPPSTLRNTDPKMVAYVNKLKMFKKKAKPKHKSLFNNVQYLVTGVSFTGGTPRYILANVSILPTGYIPINGGVVNRNGAAITVINGYWKFPKEVVDKCDESCDCLTKWENTVMDYLKSSKCKCGHLYDFYNEGKAKEKCFHQPTRHGKLWFDQAKIYQMDPWEDFIKDTIRDAMMSGEPSPEPSESTISPIGMKEKDLLAALLADLSDTPLLIPHLPKANLLNNLQEWVRKRVKGKILPKQHKQLILQSQRRWLDLKHMDFKAPTYKIPFTLKELEHFNWSHRYMVQTLTSREL
ncbi:unnamed protein product [Diatraea saccharalis]|uniref:Uncharacterized protein n=1 Tax=Diatraea saccharalis TaxID=40085 RepID=A0A9N9QZF8_9NEOP|nr:unnamed protein product [Diatraea saccharalis]